MTTRCFPSTYLLFSLCMLCAPLSATALNAWGDLAHLGGIGSKAAKMGSSTKIQALSRIEVKSGKAMRHAASTIAAKHGTSALPVLAKDPELLIPMIKALPFNKQAMLLDSLSRNPALTQALRQYGTVIIDLELRSHGQTMRIIDAFGAKGVEIGRKLNNRQLQALASASSLFHSAPAKTRTAFLDLLAKHAEKTLHWLEQHPKILMTGTAAGLVYSLRSELLGSATQGTDEATDRAVGDMMHPVITTMAPWIGAAFLGWLLFGRLRLWFQDWLNRPKWRSENDR